MDDGGEGAASSISKGVMETGSGSITAMLSGMAGFTMATAEFGRGEDGQSDAAEDCVVNEPLARTKGFSTIPSPIGGNMAARPTERHVAT